MRIPDSRRLLSVLAVTVALALAGTGGAVAQKLITGADIKDGSLTSKDLSKATVKKLKGAQGKPGPVGPRGPGAARLYLDSPTSKTVTLAKVGGVTYSATCSAATGGFVTVSLSASSPSPYDVTGASTRVSGNVPDGDQTWVNAFDVTGTHEVDSVKIFDQFPGIVSGRVNKISDSVLVSTGTAVHELEYVLSASVPPRCQVDGVVTPAS